MTLRSLIDTLPSPGTPAWHKACEEIEAGLQAPLPQPAPSPLEGPVRFDLVSDGTYCLDGGSYYGMVPRLLWEAEHRPDRKNRVGIAACNSPLIRQGARTLLVDPGIGNTVSEIRDTHGHSASKLRRDLRVLGVMPTQITDVLLTHAHLSHAGAAVTFKTSYSQDEKFLTARFKKAVHWIHEDAWDDWRKAGDSPHPLFGPKPDQLEEIGQDRVKLFHGSVEIIPGVWAHEAFGHARGNVYVTVDAGPLKALYPGDIAPSPRHVLWRCRQAGDREPERVLAERDELLARYPGWLWVFPHSMEERAGYFDVRAGKLVFKPVKL